MQDDFLDQVYHVLVDEPFYSALSRCIVKFPVNYIPTAGVRVNPDSGRFEMMYNPEFMNRLTTQEKKLVLLHEFDHLIFEHVTGRLPAGAKDDPEIFRIWNVAADHAINGEIFPKESNEKIKNLWDMAVLPEKDNFPRGKAAEYYFKAIMGDEKLKKKYTQDMQPSESGEGKEGGNPARSDGEGGVAPRSGQGFDEHSGWKEGAELPEDIKTIAQQRLKEAVEKAAQEVNCSNSSSWGTVSAEMRKKIMELITPKVNWRSVLRYFIKTSQKIDKSSTFKRYNRRFPLIHPGKKSNRTAKLAICIDQSGSVSDRMLANFFAELSKLAEFAEFTVVPFDTDVYDDKVYVWKKREKRDWDRVLCGGTCFNAPTRWVNEKNFDGMIVLTDMCAPKPIAAKCQRLWMTDAYNSKNPYFSTNEKVVSIDD